MNRQSKTNSESVTAIRGEFHTLDDAPKMLQNGSITQQSSEEKPVSNGVSHLTNIELGYVTHVNAESEKQNGLKLTIPERSDSHDESDIFSTASPTVVDVKLYTEQTDQVFAERFHLSQRIDKLLNKNRYVPKATYVITLATIVFLSYAVCYEPWLLLYYFTISMPILMILRLVMYTKLKYQYFMLDLCYFVNTAMFIFIWAFPNERELSTILLSFTSGPCALAVILFRNSLVVHSIDKVTSTYLHVIPMLMGFVIRWFPEKLNEYWYTDFVPEENYVLDIGYMCIWLWAVPFIFFIAHVFLYLCLVRVVFRPSDDHDYSFRYLSGMSGSVKGCPGQCITCCGRVGPSHMQTMYCILSIVYGVTSFVFVPLWYYFYIGHCLFICFVMLWVAWNGAGYYMDVFGPKVFK